LGWVQNYNILHIKYISLSLSLFKHEECARFNIIIGPGVYSASNRNEYQKHYNNNVPGEYRAAGA
jgi:hypothetical protein